MREYRYDNIHEPVALDDLGTVRVCEKFGTIAIYIKIDVDQWHTVYIDPRRNQHLIPSSPMSDGVAGSHPVVFVPKPVE